MTCGRKRVRVLSRPSPRHPHVKKKPGRKPSARREHAHDIAFPLIVKPLAEDGSIGINADAVVTSVKELMERMQDIQNEFDSPAIIEEYIEGREIYAAILGSYESAQALPLVELDFSKLPKGTPKIASYDVKFEKDADAYKLT